MTNRHAPPDSITTGHEMLCQRRTYFDQVTNALVVQICQGDYYVTSRATEMLSTLLGSCIAVCMRDPASGFGGMNHFLLPTGVGADEDQRTPMIYGSYLIELLTNALLKRGAKRNQIEVKLFGGANITQHTMKYGHANADFVEEYMRRERLNVIASDLRGFRPRRVRYCPHNGRAQMCYRTTASYAELAAQETKLLSSPRMAEQNNKVVIFR